jgi:hypothetical protein
MIELTFGNEFLGLALDGVLGEFEFFGERCDHKFRVASESSLKVFDLILQPRDETKNSFWSLSKESLNS